LRRLRVQVRRPQQKRRYAGNQPHFAARKRDSLRAGQFDQSIGYQRAMRREKPAFEQFLVSRGAKQIQDQIDARALAVDVVLEVGENPLIARIDFWRQGDQRDVQLALRKLESFAESLERGAGRQRLRVTLHRPESFGIGEITK
jgi:hypothetical protein